MRCCLSQQKILSAEMVSGTISPSTPQLRPRARTFQPARARCTAATRCSLARRISSLALGLRRLLRRSRRRSWRDAHPEAQRAHHFAHGCIAGRRTRLQGPVEALAANASVLGQLRKWCRKWCLSQMVSGTILGLSLSLKPAHSGTPNAEPILSP